MTKASSDRKSFTVSVKRCLVHATVGLAICAQLYLTVCSFFPSSLDDELLVLRRHDALSNTASSKRKSSPRAHTTTFGACLMTMQDNDLLYEWLAYHRTVLPLTHVVIGSDENNTHDPSLVLDRMKHLFQYVNILEPLEFINRHGPYKPLSLRKHENDTNKEQAHHALIHRQKGFITTCLERLQEQGVGWTILIDSDEYIVFHAAAEAGAVQKFPEGIPSLTSNVTALDLLEKLVSEDSSPCLTFPRLLVGSLENSTCPKEGQYPSIPPDFQQLDTLRFFQHARPGDFSQSKYGKVLIDLSRIDNSIIATQIPRNIHRPYVPLCGHPVVDFGSSPFVIHHYIGTWERYSGRSQDERRNRDEWKQRAYYFSTNKSEVYNHVTCQARMFGWMQRFIQLVGGLEQAKNILNLQ